MTSYPTFGFYNQLTGVDDRRVPAAGALVTLDSKYVPESFPMMMWSIQSSRYLDYWGWFNGTILGETKGKTKDNKEILRYPLGINPIRNFSRKHAAVLLGEETFDTAQPLVKTRAEAAPSILLSSQDESDPNNVALARVAQNIVNGVWFQSNGRGIQLENAELAQFLGGCVFKISWEWERRNELEIPIIVRNVIPDFFLPVYGDDMFDLYEAFVVRRVPGYVAYHQYGLEEARRKTWVIHCEHWTRKHFSVLIDGVPLKMKDAYQREITYREIPHPFGFVPYVYIPHLREGNFYGSSLVEDIRGLTREYNGRMADTGSAIRDTVHRRRYTRDLSANPKPKQLDSNTWAVDLGPTNVVTKAKPDVFTEDPPQMGPEFSQYNSDVWSQLMREGNIGDVAFGEDEGSQRSALTLAFRMWPTTAHSRMERTWWNEGLNRIAKNILKMCVIKQKNLPKGVVVPPDFLRKITLTQDWLPQIPRDREQIVNEVILRFQAGLLQPETAITMLGDVPYVKQEVEGIQKWLTFQAQLEATTGGAGASGEKKGADTKLQTPIATSGLGAND